MRNLYLYIQRTIYTFRRLLITGSQAMAKRERQQCKAVSLHLVRLTLNYKNKFPTMSKKFYTEKHQGSFFAKLAVLTLVCSFSFSASANAQGFLKGLAGKAKDKIEKKVEGAVDKVTGRSRNDKSEGDEVSGKGGVGNSMRQKESYGKHDGYFATSRGVFDGDDPFQNYVEELAASQDPLNWRYDNISLEMEADLISFNSIDEAMKAFPSLPTAQQMLAHDTAPVKAIVNFNSGVDNYNNTVTMRMYDATEKAKRDNVVKKGLNGAAQAQMNNGAAQIFAFLQKNNIDPDKMSDKEMEALIKKAVISGEIKLENINTGGFVVDPGYSEKQDDAIDAVSDKIDAVIEKVNEAVRSEMTFGLNTLKVEKQLRPLYTEIQSAWLTSDASKQVHDIEMDIDKRAWDYFEQTNDNNGEDIEYPDFWKQGRKKQNEIIRNFNMQQEEKWYNVMKETYDKYLPLAKELAEVDKELESTFTDKTDLIYNTLKVNLSHAFSQWKMMYQLLLNRSYGAPLVSEVQESDTFYRSF